VFPFGRAVLVKSQVKHVQTSPGCLLPWYSARRLLDYPVTHNPFRQLFSCLSSGPIFSIGSIGSNSKLFNVFGVPIFPDLKGK